MITPNQPHGDPLHAVVPDRPVRGAWILNGAPTLSESRATIFTTDPAQQDSIALERATACASALQLPCFAFDYIGSASKRYVVMTYASAHALLVSPHQAHPLLCFLRDRMGEASFAMYEVVMRDRPCCLYLDLDFPSNAPREQAVIDQITQQVMEVVGTCIADVFEIPPPEETEWIVAVRANEWKKRSRHLLWRRSGVIWQSSVHVRWFLEHHVLPVWERLHLDWRGLIDLCPYTKDAESTNHPLFRVMWSCKGTSKPDSKLVRSAICRYEPCDDPRGLSYWCAAMIQFQSGEVQRILQMEACQRLDVVERRGGPSHMPLSVGSQSRGASSVGSQSIGASSVGSQSMRASSVSSQSRGGFRTVQSMDIREKVIRLVMQRLVGIWPDERVLAGTVKEPTARREESSLLYMVSIPGPNCYCPIADQTHKTCGVQLFLFRSEAETLVIQAKCFRCGRSGSPSMRLS